MSFYGEKNERRITNYKNAKPTKPYEKETDSSLGELDFFEKNPTIKTGIKNSADFRGQCDYDTFQFEANMNKSSLEEMKNKRNNSRDLYLSLTRTSSQYESLKKTNGQRTDRGKDSYTVLISNNDSFKNNNPNQNQNCDDGRMSRNNLFF